MSTKISKLPLLSSAASPPVGKNILNVLPAKCGEERSAATVTVRQSQRQATRERLIQATINLLRQEGVGAVTTVSVTRAAGIVQSGFYLHFKNIDECLRVAAERVAEGIRQYIAETRREMHTINAEDFNLLRGHCEKMLEIFNTERRFAEIFLHHRHDRSSLGEVMRELKTQIHADLVEDLQNVLFRRRSVTSAQLERTSLQAEIILAAALIVGEALVENRISRMVTAAELLALNIVSLAGNTSLKTSKALSY